MAHPQLPPFHACLRHGHSSMRPQATASVSLRHRGQAPPESLPRTGVGGEPVLGGLSAATALLRGLSCWLRGTWTTLGPVKRAQRHGESLRSSSWNPCLLAVRCAPPGRCRAPGPATPEAAALHSGASTALQRRLQETARRRWHSESTPGGRATILQAHCERKMKVKLHVLSPHNFSVTGKRANTQVNFWLAQ